MKLNVCKDFQSVHIWKTKIEQHEIEIVIRYRTERRQSFRGREGAFRFKSCLSENQSKGFDRSDIVVDYKQTTPKARRALLGQLDLRPDHVLIPD